MLGAYGWAFVKPVRKLYYNLTITSVSVLVALVVGGVEGLGVFSQEFNVTGGSFWNFINLLDDNFGYLDYSIIGIFVLSWLVAVLVYKLKRYEQLELKLASQLQTEADVEFLSNPAQVHIKERKMAVPATIVDPVLDSIRASTAAIRSLMILDGTGRSQMAFMRGHMSEILKHTNAKEYFADFYTSVAQEFMQYDDYGFALHHCLRFLYLHWQEEINQLRGGMLGLVLREISGEFPEIRDKPTMPTRRPGAVQGSWYSEVYDGLSVGTLPRERGIRNEALAPEACVLGG